MLSFWVVQYTAHITMYDSPDSNPSLKKIFSRAYFVKSSSTWIYMPYRETALTKDLKVQWLRKRKLSVSYVTVSSRV